MLNLCRRVCASPNCAAASASASQSKVLDTIGVFFRRGQKMSVAKVKTRGSTFPGLICRIRVQQQTMCEMERDGGGGSSAILFCQVQKCLENFHETMFSIRTLSLDRRASDKSRSNVFCASCLWSEGWWQQRPNTGGVNLGISKHSTSAGMVRERVDKKGWGYDLIEGSKRRSEAGGGEKMWSRSFCIGSNYVSLCLPWKAVTEQHVYPCTFLFLPEND